MTEYVLKKVRNGKKSRTWYGRYRLAWMPKLVEVNLQVTEKQVAESKLHRLVINAQLEHEGMIPLQSVREAAQKNINLYLYDFLQDRRTIGRAESYLVHLKNFIMRVCQECQWRHLNQIRADRFEQWRNDQKLTGKTLNDYLSGFKSFLKWCNERGYVAGNPLAIVKKMDLRRCRRQMRRSLTLDEINRLLAAASPINKAAYLLAVYSGIRRGEIKALEWGDVNFSQRYIRLRADITKNKKEKLMPLRPEQLAALELIRPENATGKIFPSLARFYRMNKEWIKAGITLLDANGKHADFHSLRMTYCTMMAQAGVPQRVAQEAMRHSDPRLTAITYTDTTMLNLREAQNMLPALGEQAREKGAQIGAHAIVKSSQNLSFAVKTKPEEKYLQVVDNVPICHDLTTIGKRGKMVGAEGFEPPTLWSQTKCASQAALCPDIKFLFQHLTCVRISKQGLLRNVL